MALLTACTDFFSKAPLANPTVSDMMLKRLKVHPRDHDQASLEWRLEADLTQYWNWNTKIIFAYVQAEYETKLNSVNQASLFDVIITKQSKAALKGKVKQKYEFMDQGKHMRGMLFNLTMTWCIMPRVGALRTYEEHLGTFQMPDEYTGAPQALMPA
eukprot:jgi/Ulvmu1/5065/UM021_0082.1